MDSAPPDWQDGDCCFRCRSQFTLVARKHHCRNCGNIFCAKCSSQQIPLPKLNIDKAVRVCDGCYEKFAVKNEDPLVKSGNKDPCDNKSEASVSKSSSASVSSTTSKSDSSNTKSTAKASAPSENELKEEEELQLALALSLSEAPPTKIQFPDCKQLEEPKRSSTSTAGPNPVVNQHYASQPHNETLQHHQPIPSQQIQHPSLQYHPLMEQPQPQQQVQAQIPELDTREIDSDKELMHFVAEVQSTAEVFANRIESNIARNRPVEGDTAIQSLFLKLNNMHAKLLEHIKVHDEERAKYEAIQDKLSQISDARAALDALREEHQEKVRQEAAEAERLRQSQLASKLEMMRQKKSQMMQYQRDLALQRIQEQEMMLSQQRLAASSNPQQQQTGQQPTTPPTTTTGRINIPPQTTFITNRPAFHDEHQGHHEHHDDQPRQPIQHHSQLAPSHAPMMIMPPQGAAPGTIVAQQAPPSVPISLPKQDDEAPLISFDD